MRVLHLSTSAVGGAAIAAQRLHAAMLGADIESALISRGPSSGAPEEHVLSMDATDRLRSKLTTQACKMTAREPLSFFSPWSSRFVSDDVIRGFAPDAVIVHNWFNLLGTSAHGMLAELGIPVVFVLHDERLFTGGCHHAGACAGFTSTCSDCPQAQRLLRPCIAREQRQMRDRLLALRTTVVGPSAWIVGEARRSSVLRGVDVHHIPNPIDTDTFTPSLRDAARARFGFAADDLVLAWQPGKGDELIAPVMRSVMAAAAGRRVVLLQTGAGTVAGVETRDAGLLRSEADRAAFWAAADVAFTLTQFDNFPNIALEAMACGVPFVTPDVGGAGEAVRATGGGLVAERSPQPIADALLRLMADETVRNDLGNVGRNGVARHYGIPVVVARYGRVLTPLVD